MDSRRHTDASFWLGLLVLGLLLWQWTQGPERRRQDDPTPTTNAPQPADGSDVSPSRARHRSVAEGDAAVEAEGCPDGCTEHRPGCDVKGNISQRTGERIYHVPGQRYYEKTIIQPEEGERWFCTEAEAMDNGWRKSKV